MNERNKRQNKTQRAPATTGITWLRAATGVGWVTILMLAAVACGPRAGSAPCSSVTELESIAPVDLPEGLGRGYPVVCIPEDESNPPAVETGAPAPNFYMLLDKNTAANGRQFSLDSLRGKPVFINFWASWCGPCRQEMPDIVQVAGQDSDLVVLAVNVQEEAAAYAAFVEEFGMEMPVVLDQDGELRRLYGIRNMPTSIFINRDGTVATIWAGFLTPDKLQEFIRQIL